MERWNTKTNEEVENKAIDAFLAEVVDVCKKHGLSISHEDGHGAFEIEKFKEANIKWLMDANDSTN